MNNKKLLIKIMELKESKAYKEYYSWIGKKFASMESGLGFPFEIAMNELKKKETLTTDQEAMILIAYQEEEIIHKLNSGFVFECQRHKDINKKNKEDLDRILNNKSIGTL